MNMCYSFKQENYIVVRFSSDAIAVIIRSLMEIALKSIKTGKESFKIVWLCWNITKNFSEISVPLWII